MTTMTAPTPTSAFESNEKPINLFQLGVLFVVRTRYWTCKAGNEANELNLSPSAISAKAIASFGTKDLIDPEKGRKVFQQIEKKARHELSRYSRPFAAANAHFVPWEHLPALVEKLEQYRVEFAAATEQFIADYPELRTGWQTAHPEIPSSVYPQAWELHDRFSFGWHSFKVAGASEALAIDDIEAELSRRDLRTEQLDQMKENLRAECRQFAADYVTAFRREVGEFCDHVIEAGGKVHGKTLQAIRRKIEHFHQMNVFDDADAAAKLQQLKAQIQGVSGEDLAQQPGLAGKLNEACAALKRDMLDPSSVSALTGRLKRRVVL